MKQKGRKTTKQQINEGIWFAVPLRSAGFAVGVVARTTADGGIVLAYFFGRVCRSVPSLEAVINLEPQNAIRVWRVGDLGLIDGTWPIIGVDPNWDHDKWVVPLFARKDDISHRAWSVQYADDDANIVVAEVPVQYDIQLEGDALHGAGAVEIVLTKLLTLDQSGVH